MAHGDGMTAAVGGRFAQIESSLAALAAAQTQQEQVSWNLDAGMKTLSDAQASQAAATGARFDSVENVLMGVGTKQASLESIMQQLATGQVELQKTCMTMAGNVDAMRGEIGAGSRGGSGARHSKMNDRERSPYGTDGATR